MFIANLPIYKKLTRQRSINFAKYLTNLIPDNTNVLDFGCGNMFTAQEMLKINPGLQITGIDVIKDQNLDENFFKDERLNFKLLQTKELPFDDNSFDISFSLAVLHHTEDPEYYLSELKRVTKHTGSIIIIEEMYINLLDRFYISSQDWLLNKLKTGVPVPLNFRSHKHYIKEFKKQELEIEFEDGIRAFLTGMHVYVYQLKKKRANILL